MPVPERPLPDDDSTDWTTGFGSDDASPATSLGQVLLDEGHVSLLELAVARQESRRTGERLARTLGNMGAARPDVIAGALATLHDILFEPGPLPPVDEEAYELIPAEFCRTRIVTPLRISDDGQLVVAMSDPEDEEALAYLQERSPLPIEPVVSTERAIRESIRDRSREQDTWASVEELFERTPEQSARHVLSKEQRVIGIVVLVLVVTALVLTPRMTLLVASSLMMVLYSMIAVFKLVTATMSVRQRKDNAVPAPAVADEDLPAYTILVPLYDEAAILPRLAKGLAAIDYPVSLLDVKLLLEEDDAETIRVARELELPSFVDIVVTPHSEPRTKPKSCNYGLRYARGEFVVIFDAEDVPEPDQLRRMVALFRTLPDEIVCVQAHLNYFNRGQNLLTRWFTGEYSGWFDLVVPGLDALHLPFPLGGTSNHFRTSALVEVGAWDPFNVTEDADLGIRLAARGFRSTVLESTTYEEANSETFNWIRQRSRWVKGYIQTWLVHMRSPITFMRQVGVRDFLGFNAIVGGTFLVFLLNPLQWLVLLLWALTQAHVVRELFPGWIFYMAWGSFMLGNFAFAYTNLVAVMRRGYYDLAVSAIVSPIYWGLMSIAAWRGLLQLMWAPSYWEKTEHGLDLAPVPSVEELRAT